MPDNYGQPLTSLLATADLAYQGASRLNSDGKWAYNWYLFLPLGMATSVAPGPLLVSLLAWIGKVFLLAVAVTVTESTNAKLRLFRVPELISLSLGLAFLALAIRFL